MKAKGRRKLEASARALGFCEENPDDGDPGYVTSVARLKALVADGTVQAQAQRAGILEVRTATALRHAKRRTMLGTHVAHLGRVAELAAQEDPEVKGWFTMSRAGRNQFGAFLTAARVMAARADEKRDLLARHGLSPKVLDDFKRELAAVEQLTADWNAGRARHVAASAKLEAIATEAIEVVRALDGFNRLRFAGDVPMLTVWRASSTVRATPHHQKEAPPPVAPAITADVRPAA
ncbi:MAG TPA: hypothetical protein VFQ38_18370 [Longimicrobiales bacterium]|nr:hypothetical protein [Longimicrobiales bacterium]